MFTKLTLIHRLLAILVITSLLLMPTSGVSASNGAPPPLGPPKPWSRGEGDPISSLPVDWFTYNLKDYVDESVADINAYDPKKDWRYTVTWEFYGSKIPWGRMSYTEYPNRPNERFVNLEYKLKFHIDNIMKCKVGEEYEVKREALNDPNYGCTSYPVERYISQQVDLQLFCDKWQTGYGKLKLLVHADRAHLEDEQGTFEEVINTFSGNTLTPYIDSQVRQRIKNMPAGFVTSKDFPFDCDALSYYKAPFPKYDQINWSYHPPSVQTTSTNNDQIKVKLVSVKRLVAHDEYDEPVYDVVEAPDVEMYANDKHLYVSLPPMQEGDEVTVKTVNAPTMVVPRTPSLESLVVIANVFPKGAGTPDLERSAYRVFSSNANFGSGTQSIIVKKSYTTPPKTNDGVTDTPVTDGPHIGDGPGGPIIYSGIPGEDKPSVYWVDAYELVFEVILTDNLNH